MPSPRRVGDLDWSRWEPVDRATLLFVLREDQVLLIRKKRGLGAGKINAPGGRLEAGETAQAGAVREVEEEVGVTPLHVERRGELSFQFVDGYSLHATVFLATDCRGAAIETDEAIPLWTPTTRIPYEEMWADDRLWVPLLLAGQHFTGCFIFEGDRMLDQRVAVVDR